MVMSSCLSSHLNSYDGESIDTYEPVLEFIASKHPSTWLKIAELYEDHKVEDWLRKAEIALRRYLEHNPANITIWNRLISLYRRIGDDAAVINALVSMCMSPGIPFDVLSNSANELNKIFHQAGSPIDTNEKHIVVLRLAELLEGRIDEATADDCSRLAWLFLHLRNPEKAGEIVERGLVMEPYNEHCQNLRKRLDTK